jgi:hypothetical protein
MRSANEEIHDFRRYCYRIADTGSSRNLVAKVGSTKRREETEQALMEGEICRPFGYPPTFGKGEVLPRSDERGGEVKWSPSKQEEDE